MHQNNCFQNIFSIFANIRVLISYDCSKKYIYAWNFEILRNHNIDEL